ncbi:MAG TPA: sigma-54 dependent transcriptional regulator [Candidatus Acidoferrum sp.]|nr:sigma-54 dependent transcriptional regulator [Candidatus Acidoferrum sp.]
MRSGVLIVDDDEIQRADLAEVLSSLGFPVATAGDGREALERLATFEAGVILTDLMMPRMDGFELLKELNSRGDRTPAIVLTGCGTIGQAVSVVHDLQAFWFLDKPVEPAVLRALVERAMQQSRLLDETDRLSRQLSYQGVLGDLVGDSQSMKEIFSLVRQVAGTTASVLITGESGTGKELLARAIHQLSSRSDGPFVAVNCAALPETLIESELFGHEKGAFTGAVERRAGCFEQAQSGTLMLDEIGEMPIGTQAKLLRVLEESKVRRLAGSKDIPINVRVVAATNQDPKKAIETNRLREDLYYRLNVFHIMLPPLRDRKSDIPAIADALIRNLNRKHSCRVNQLSPEVLRRFQEYNWPGNVRELRNVIERAVIVAGEGEVLMRHLPGMLVPAAPKSDVPREQSDDSMQVRVGDRIDEIEEAYIRLVLKYTNNNKTRAAEIIGISLRTLHHKLHAYAEQAAKGVAVANGS